MQDHRNSRAQIAQQTLDILEKGFYRNDSGEIVNIADQLKASVENTRTFTPEELERNSHQARQIIEKEPKQCIYEVISETTLECAERLVVIEKEKNVCCLNFASARNPGGGFLGGSQAQEESLARSSGLYACLKPQTRMYDANRAFASTLYTDHMILSPLVPVIRDDAGQLLSSPFLISILPAPAVNAGALRTNEPGKIKDIGKVMFNRIIKLLSLAIISRQNILILGAWGCGVFQNKPEEVASYFKEALSGSLQLERGFKRIIFVIPDRSEHQKMIAPFKAAFLNSRK